MTSSPLHGRLCIIIAVSIIRSSLSVVGLSIQEAHAQTSTNKTAGWTRFGRKLLLLLYPLDLFWVISIDCLTPEDGVVGDETVVKMFGADYYQWGPQSMRADETKSIDWGVDFSGRSPISIQVWDYDWGWWLDEHDMLGRHEVPYQLTHGIVYYTFDWDDALYVLAVEVLPHRH